MEKKEKEGGEEKKSLFQPIQPVYKRITSLLQFNFSNGDVYKSFTTEKFK